MGATAPKKRAAKGSPSPASPRVVSVGGEPIGRFARVLAEAREKGMAIEPYPVTDGLTLYPPTDARLQAMDQASAAKLLAQASIAALLSNESVAPPMEPTEQAPTEDPRERAEWLAARRKELSEQRVAWIQQRQNELDEGYRQVEAAVTAYNEALFGDAEVYQQVNEYFVTRPAWERRAFEKDITEVFLKLPVDDHCQACGQAVKPEAGEPAGESSGGSSTSGTSSTVTSPSSSTESTSSTGSVEPAAGPSS